MSAESNSEKIPNLDELVQEVEANPKPIKSGRGGRILQSGVTEMEELFCQEFVKHRDAIRAVKVAGFEIKNPQAAYNMAYKVKSRERVQNRIDQLIAQAVRRNNITVDGVLEMIMKTYAAAMEASRFDAANQATKMLVDYMQMNSPKSASVTNILNIQDRSMLDKEIERLARAASIPLQLPAPIDVLVEEVKNEKSVQDQGDSGLDK